ncbi:MAG: glycine/sarcosine/betaine reductase selenoprotein B family protein [Anaerolineae bacterium]|jgi:D-proline reductase (dithiol) PrdB
MAKTVDSKRFLSGITKRLVKSWIKLETPREIPWTPLAKPLSDCTVALISSGGLALKTDRPFDQEGERQNPWWGDPSYRVIPRTATEEDVNIYHLHVDPAFVTQDLNCLLPLQRLAEMEAAGEIGRAAPSHYSFMGYTVQPEALLQESTPAIIDHLQNEEVDVVVLIPA